MNNSCIYLILNLYLKVMIFKWVSLKHDFPLKANYKKANSYIKYSRFINLEMWCIQKPHDKMSQITMVLLCGPKPLHFIAEITKTQLHIYKEKTYTWSLNHTNLWHKIYYSLWKWIKDKKIVAINSQWTCNAPRKNNASLSSPSSIHQ